MSSETRCKGNIFFRKNGGGTLENMINNLCGGGGHILLQEKIPFTLCFFQKVHATHNNILPMPAHPLSHR